MFCLVSFERKLQDWWIFNNVPRLYPVVSPKSVSSTDRSSELLHNSEQLKAKSRKAISTFQLFVRDPVNNSYFLEKRKFQRKEIWANCKYFSMRYLTFTSLKFNALSHSFTLSKYCLF